MNEDIKETLSAPNPPISVIIPLFNKAPFLLETINGVFSQNYGPLEILIRDDGSNDNSLEVMKQIPDRYPDKNIRLFHGDNVGASACRNFLIENASHRLIILMDADDVMLPGFIQSALEAMKSKNARVVYSDVEISGVKVGEWCPQPFDQYAIRYDNCLTSLALLDRELWVEVGGYDPGLPFNEDWSFFIKAAAITDRFHKLDGKYFRYRQTQSGLYHSYINDNWNLNRSLVMVASPELYPVSEIMEALKNLAQIPDTWVNKYEECVRKHPNNPLPWIVLSIAALGRGDEQRFSICLQQALHHSRGKDWLPFFIMGNYLEQRDLIQAASYFHFVRTKRPDMAMFVNDKIKRALEKQIQVNRPDIKTA